MGLFQCDTKSPDGKEIWNKVLKEQNDLLPVGLDSKINPYFYTREGIIYTLNKRDEIVKINIDKNIIIKPEISIKNEITILCNDGNIYCLNLKDINKR